MNNPMVIPTNSRFNLPLAQLDEIYGRLEGVFKCLPANRVSTGNAKYKVAEAKKAKLADWFPTKAGS
jgi:hypothetical protein